MNKLLHEPTVALRGIGGGALMRSRLRFIVALSVALVLGGWLAYTSLGGTLETYASPGQMTARATTYRLNGTVGRRGADRRRRPGPDRGGACASR